MTPWARARLAGILTLAALVSLAIHVAPLSAQYGKGPGGSAPYAYLPPERNEAGRFDYYSLVLSWSPTYCAGQRDREEPQCNPRDGRHYAFVLHGLWPQHERGWPENCRMRDRPFVPRPTIDRMLDIMPSPRLVIHEYRKHGTCSGLAPDAYYDLARRLYAKVKIPQRFVRPNQSFFVTPGDLREEFLSANPGLKDESVAVSCGGPGGRLREVRICFSREGEFRPCGRNEDSRRLCSQPRMYVPPVRGGGGGADRERSPLPGPLDRRI